MAGRRAIVSIGISLSFMALLAACSRQNANPEPPRPVLVARADAAFGAPATATAYAGEIRARQETALSFRIGGKLARRLVDTGERVRRGDLLAELDPGDMRLQAESLQAQLTAAEAQLARVRADQARIASLAKDQLVSRSALDQQTAALRAAEGQARAARAQRDTAFNQASYTQLRAPADGAVAARLAEAGQVLAPGQTVFAFVTDGEREVAFALPEANISDFSVGQPVLIELWNGSGRPLSGRIREIAPMADAATRTYAARASLAPEHAQQVVLGQSARVYIPTAAEKSMELPLAAIQQGADGAAAVWIADVKAGRVRKATVRIGAYAADRVPVLSGLSPQDWVVVAGGHLLHEGQQVVAVDRSNRPVGSK